MAARSEMQQQRHRRPLGLAPSRPLGIALRSISIFQYTLSIETARRAAHSTPIASDKRVAPVCRLPMRS